MFQVLRSRDSPEPSFVDVRETWIQVALIVVGSPKTHTLLMPSTVIKQQELVPLYPCSKSRLRLGDSCGEYMYSEYCGLYLSWYLPIVFHTSRACRISRIRPKRKDDCKKIVLFLEQLFPHSNRCWNISLDP
jgi:hypothetical protein